ncbi:MAG TPA: DoxX family protein [Fimbriimonadales bacterium]|nr:DoxX family protein [Fimbriimonadales bacterium]
MPKETAVDKEDRSIDLALLVLRLVLGVIMMAHGLQKMGVVPGGAATIGEQIDTFAKMGFPAWLGYLSVIAEAAGGLGVLIGLFGRLAAFGIAVDLFVAIVKVHITHGFFSAKGGFEFPLALFGIAAALMFTGMGRVSIDAILARAMDKDIGVGGKF